MTKKVSRKALLFLLLFTGCLIEDINLDGYRKVGFVTDSIGADLNYSSDGRYPAIFAEMFVAANKTGWAALPRGRAGATIFPCCWFDHLGSLTTELLDSHPEVDGVVFQMGINDATKEHPPEVVAQELVAIKNQVENATRYGEKHAQVWMALIHYVMPFEDHVAENSLIDLYNQLIREQFPGRYLDFPSVITADDYTDSKHFTACGQYKLAKLVFETFMAQPAPLLNAPCNTPVPTPTQTG